MIELKPCPWCKGKATVNVFISQVAQLPEPKKLFGRWSLIKMRYKELPLSYSAECAEFCDGYADYCGACFGKTPEEAAAAWNVMATDMEQEDKL